MKGWIQKYLGPYSKTITSVFFLVAGWAYAQNCGTVVGVSILDTIHLTCEQVQDILNVVGAFLLGGGILSADEFARARFKKKAEEPKP